MKKSLLLIALAAFGCLALVSCGEKTPTNDTTSSLGETDKDDSKNPTPSAKPSTDNTSSPSENTTNVTSTEIIDW